MIESIVILIIIAVVLIIVFKAVSNILLIYKSEKNLYLKSDNHDKNRNNKPMHGITKAGNKTWRYN